MKRLHIILSFTGDAMRAIATLRALFAAMWGPPFIRYTIHSIKEMQEDTED